MPIDGTNKSKTKETATNLPPLVREEEEARVSLIIDKMDRKIMNRVASHHVIKKHLISGLTKMNSRHALLEASIEVGLLHLLKRDAPSFERNDPNKSNSLI